jgi:hypothetical protein
MLPVAHVLEFFEHVHNFRQIPNILCIRQLNLSWYGQLEQLPDRIKADAGSHCHGPTGVL